MCTDEWSYYANKKLLLKNKDDCIKRTVDNKRKQCIRLSSRRKLQQQRRRNLNEGDCIINHTIVGG